MRIGDVFPSNYLKASDLNGKVVPVTIREVKTEQVGRDKEWKAVIYFEGKDKGVVLNKTNAKKIVEIAGSDDTDDWPGVVIALYATEVDFQGDTVEAIRVRPATGSKAKPKPAPEPVEMPADDIPF